MANTVLVIGKSGSGKSRSIKNLDPEKTVIVNVIEKPLPFKGWKSKYSEFKGPKGGNLFVSDNYADILKAMDCIDKHRSEIKTIVIDDFQYVMANEFMRRCNEKGYEKFNQIGEHAWQLLWNSRLLRQDLTIFFLCHSDTSDTGEVKAKSIGKMLDDKICIEGMFTIVLNTHIDDGSYYFETQNTGNTTAKSPEGMFESLRIENDLQYVLDSINNYEKGE